MYEKVVVGRSDSVIERAMLPLVLLGSIGLLQYHSIQFWALQVGGTGWAWSVLLEVAALWLWYAPRTHRRLLGLVASLLLLAGPLYVVTSPIISHDYFERTGAERRAMTVSALEDEIAQLESSLATFLRNSEVRPGWLPTIQRTQDAIIERRASLRNLLIETDSVGLSWQRQTVIIMQAAALVLFQIAAVMAITSLSARQNLLSTRSLLPVADSTRDSMESPSDSMGDSSRSPSDSTGTPSDSMGDSIVGKNGGDEITPELVGKISQAFSEYLRDNKVSQRSFAAQTNCNQRDLSLLLRHQEVLREGGRTASEITIRRVGVYLGILGRTRMSQQCVM